MVEKKPVSVEISALRRPYAPPRLVELGDLRSLTLGGSPGANDSGMGDPRRPLIITEAPFPPSNRTT